jgi:hypothetical protein
VAEVGGALGFRTGTHGASSRNQSGRRCTRLNRWLWWSV